MTAALAATEAEYRASAQTTQDAATAKAAEAAGAEAAAQREEAESERLAGLAKSYRAVAD